MFACISSFTMQYFQPSGRNILRVLLMLWILKGQLPIALKSAICSCVAKHVEHPRISSLGQTYYNNNIIYYNNNPIYPIKWTIPCYWNISIPGPHTVDLIPVSSTAGIRWHAFSIWLPNTSQSSSNNPKWKSLSTWEIEKKVCVDYSIWTINCFSLVHCITWSLMTVNLWSQNERQRIFYTSVNDK